MRGHESVRIVFCLCAMGVATACSEIVGADFDVHLRRVDGSASRSGDASNDGISDANASRDGMDVDRAESDARSRDSQSTDVGDVAVDAHVPDVRISDASADGEATDADAGPTHDDVASDGTDDIVDAGSDPRQDTGSGRPTIVSGGFVSLGAPSQQGSQIRVQGQIVYGGNMRGVTATGITIEGRFQ